MILKSIQGERIPALGLGTYRLQGPECRAAVKDALELGYRHIDTAQSYGNEDDVGRGIADASVERGDIFLTTKVALDNLDPASVRSSTHGSLRKLKSDYVDLLLIHWPSDDVPLERSLDAMIELREEGKARHLGVSNFPPDLARAAAEHAGILANQVEYHPFLSQEDLTRQAVEFGYLLTAYSPIARGRVSDDETLREIGRHHGKTPAQVSLRWLIQQPNIAAIPKASSAEHRRSNLDIFDFELSVEEMDSIFGLAQGERLVDPAWGPEW